MANFRRRTGARRGRSRYLLIAVAAFVGVNLVWLLRGSGAAPSQTNAGAGEGGHRYRHTEEHDNGSLTQPDSQAAAGTAGGGDGTAVNACHAEQDAEFEGEEALQWGDKHLKDSPEECCAACQERAPRCNVWVYCNKSEGCGGGRSHRECWLKNKRDLEPAKPRARRAPGSGWVSGAIYTQAEYDAAMVRIEAAKSEEQRYLDNLRANETLPLVFLDVEIKQKPVGRIEMVLFSDVSPRAAENFRQLCTGESGVVPTDPPGKEGAGKARHFKSHYFYRIIDQFIDQTGVETESVFGGQFKDDPGGLKLKHDRKGLLSMANMGHDTNTAHFSIMMGPAPHLNGDYTIFGQAVSGLAVIDAINALSKGKPDNTATQEDGAQIVDSGQLRKGSIVPDLTLGL